MIITESGMVARDYKLSTWEAVALKRIMSSGQAYGT